MRFMTAAICFLTMTLSCVAPGWAGTGTVSGHLQDPDGNAVSGYRVSAYAVKQQGGGNPVALASSDSKRQFHDHQCPGRRRVYSGGRGKRVQ